MAPTLCDHCGDAVVNATSAKEEISRVDGCDLLDELSQLEALMARLTIKQCDVKTKINQFYSSIVRKLPPDVMSIIFEFCLPDFADFQPSLPSPRDLCVPLFLGAVCKYWREIAWSTPSLWSSLVVRVIPSKCDSRTAIVQEWLSRSGQLPLSIRIVSTLSMSKNEPAVILLADIINQHSSRWSDFELYMPQALYRYFHATDNLAPILKSILLYMQDFEDERCGENFELTCPRLERACLSLARPDKINIQWDNLTHLHLKDMFIFEYLAILRKTSLRLDFLSFSGVEGLVEQLAEVPVVTSLRSLHVEVLNHFAKKFLDYLLCPRLEELILGANHLHAPMKAIDPFIKRSACSLRSFTISDTSASTCFEKFMTQDLTHLLELMPSLKKLSITARSSDRYNLPGYLPDRSVIFRLMAKVLSSQRASCQQKFLPNLEVLEYTGNLYLFSGNYAKIYDSLPPADNTEQGPLQIIELDLYPVNRLPTNAISFFLSLVERGLTVNVCSQSQDILQSSIDHYAGRERQDWIDDLDLSLMQDLF